MKYLTLLLVSSLLFSCASRYRLILPSSSYYSKSEVGGDVDVSYKYEVLRETGNRKYAKRENRKGIRVVAVRVKNNSARAITIGQDAFFYTGESEVRLVEPANIHRALKQGVPVYLLYLLLTPLNFYTDDGRGNVENTPIGLVLGPAISIGNMLGAGGANQSFLGELQEFNLINKKIEPGETTYGLIGVYDLGYNPIRVKLK